MAGILLTSQIKVLNYKSSSLPNLSKLWEKFVTSFIASGSVLYFWYVVDWMLSPADRIIYTAMNNQTLKWSHPPFTGHLHHFSPANNSKLQIIAFRRIITILATPHKPNQCSEYQNHSFYFPLWWWRRRVLLRVWPRVAKGFCSHTLKLYNFTSKHLKVFLMKLKIGSEILWIDFT